MFKWGMLYSLLLFSLFNSSCQKEEDQLPVQDTPSAENYSSARLSDLITSTNIDNPATYKGMYVDDVGDIIGNTTKENNLLDYAADKGINAFAFYGLKNVISSSSNYAKVRSFLSKCTQYGITTRIYVIVHYPGSVNGNDTTYIKNFNHSCIYSSQKITGINMEWEWWNGATTWTTYKNTLKAFYNWSKRMSPELTNEVYLGWFKNPVNMELTMANEIVKYCDRIVVHDYRVAPDVGYMEERMDYLGQAAMSQGKTKKIIVLFSAEAVFMGPYFSNNSYNTAYQSIVSQYTSSAFPGKSGLRVYGWQVYNYSYAKVWRP